MVFSNKRRIETNRPSKDQIECLVDFMMKHSLFARRQIMLLGNQGNVIYKKLWKSLTTKLNNLGICKKTCVGWQKTWTRLRISSKTKRAKFNSSYNKTGHNEVDDSLTEIDHTICNIFGKYGLGLNVVPELGLPPDNLIGVSKEKSEVHVTYSNENIRNRKSGVKVNKPNGKQIDKLVSFMKEHPQLANGTEIQPQPLWQKLANDCNYLDGGCAKTPEAWSRTWSNLVGAAKSAVEALSLGILTTAIAPHYLKISQICGFDKIVSSKNQDVSENNGCTDGKAKKVTLKREVDVEENMHTSQVVKKFKLDNIVDLTYNENLQIRNLSSTKAIAKKPLVKPKPTSTVTSSVSSGQKVQSFQKQSPSLVSKRESASTSNSKQCGNYTLMENSIHYNRAANLLTDLEQKSENLIEGVRTTILKEIRNQTSELLIGIPAIVKEVINEMKQIPGKDIHMEDSNADESVEMEFNEMNDTGDSNINDENLAMKNFNGDQFEVDLEQGDEYLKLLGLKPANGKSMQVEDDECQFETEYLDSEFM